jgi:uroporphyrin-III C-methyltransferase / precorrin-2 dehydrogenase / sirohydrochlorin ferrochelatase
MQLVRSRGRRPPQPTTIVYMPAKTLAAAAIAAGLDAATPAVAVINATRPDETVIRASIADLPQRLAATTVGGPVVVMIGRVFARAAAADVAGAQTASQAAG